MFFRIEYLCTFTDSQTLSLFRTALQKEHNQSLESIHCMSFQSGQKKTFPWQAWGHTRYNLSLDFCCGTQWKWLGPLVEKIQEDDSILPSGYVKIAIENSPFIIDLAIQNGDLL